MAILSKKEIKNVCKFYIDDKKFNRVNFKEIYLIYLRQIMIKINIDKKFTIKVLIICSSRY